MVGIEEGRVGLGLRRGGLRGWGMMHAWVMEVGGLMFGLLGSNGNGSVGVLMGWGLHWRYETSRPMGTML